MSSRNFVVRVGCRLSDLSQVAAAAAEPVHVEVRVNGLVLCCGDGYGSIVDGGVEFHVARKMTLGEQEQEDKRRPRPTPTSIPGSGRLL